MGYYSCIRGNEVRTHVIIWMNLEIVVLSEGEQTWKVTYCMTPFI